MRNYQENIFLFQTVERILQASFSHVKSKEDVGCQAACAHSFI